MRVQLSVVFTVLFAAVPVSLCHHVPGYYWRDFYGTVPEDAFPGGTDTDCKPIYIGQVFAKNNLMPAKIYSNDNQAYYAYEYKEYSTTKDIKILCTQNPDQFEWLKTNTEELGLIVDKHLVIGGSQPANTIYIGRVRANAEILVGKVMADTSKQYLGLHVPSNGKGVQFTSYEVLSYNYSYTQTSIL